MKASDIYDALAEDCVIRRHGDVHLTYVLPKPNAVNLRCGRAYDVLANKGMLQNLISRTGTTYLQNADESVIVFATPGCRKAAEHPNARHVMFMDATYGCIENNKKYLVQFVISFCSAPMQIGFAVMSKLDGKSMTQALQFLRDGIEPGTYFGGHMAPDVVIYIYSARKFINQFKIISQKYLKHS